MDRSRYLSLFVEDAARRLAESAGAIPVVAGGGDPATPALATLFRHVHTLKGMSAQLGFAPIALLAHTLEDLCDGLRTGKLPADAAACRLLEEGVERLTEMVNGIAAGTEPEPAPDVEQAIRSHLRSQGTTAFTVVEPPPPEPQEVPRPRDDDLMASLAELLAVGQRLRILAVTDPRLEYEGRRVEEATRRIFARLAEARQVSFETLLPAIRRHLRALCSQLNKEASLEVTGEETLVDPTVLATLQGVLVQIVNNALVHGIEPATERRRKGKPGVGRVSIAVSREGEEFVLTAWDDGRGFDTVALRELARRSRDEDGTDRDIHTTNPIARPRLPRLPRGAHLAEAIEHAFLDGVSTAAELGEYAGRGHGLGAILQAVTGMGGTLQATNSPGEGARFRMVVPVQQRIEELLLVREGGITLAYLARTIDDNAPSTRRPASATTNAEFLVLKGGGRRRVEAVLGVVDGLVSPAPFPFNQLPRVNGTTVAPDGSILFVVDSTPPAPGAHS